MQKLLSSSSFNLFTFVVGFLCFCGFFYGVVLTYTQSYVTIETVEVKPVTEQQPEPEKPKLYVPPAEIEMPFF